MRSPVSALLVCVALACAGQPDPVPAPTADAASLRHPPAGPVVGFVGAYGAHAWLGLPFAKPPVGDMRWRAPQALPAWSGTREALAFGASCMQFASALGGDESAEPGTPVGSEDCLFLNVYAPAADAASVLQVDARLPVMLWIHGGGNTVGSSSFYDGGNLAQRENVVVVTINYRLGPFGWLHHPALAEGVTPAEQGGNFAMLDMVRALEWVRDNIAAFGGDPGNVTIFGESAGGRNVVTLLVSPLARGLFHRAIVQSGGARSNSLAEAANYRDDAQPGLPNSSREVALRLLAPDASDRAAAKRALAALSAEEIAQRLRGLAASTVLTAYVGDHIGLIEMPQVFRDGVSLPQEEMPARFATPDGVAAVPTMLGTNRDENKLFLFLNPEHVRRWFGVLPQVKDEAHYQLVAEYQSRSWKAAGADELAMALVGTGRDDVFVYRWDWDEEPSILWANLGELIGAAHGLEIPFVFGHWNLGRQGKFLFDDENAPGRDALSAAMMSYWAEFARSGNPGKGTRGELPSWTAWSASEGGDKFVVLDTEAGGGLRMTREGVETNRALVAAMRSDPRLADAAKRCELLALLVRWSANLDESDYAAGGCEGNPVVASGE